MNIYMKFKLKYKKISFSDNCPRNNHNLVMSRRMSMLNMDSVAIPFGDIN